MDLPAASPDRPRWFANKALIGAVLASVGVGLALVAVLAFQAFVPRSAEHFGGMPRGDELGVLWRAPSFSLDAHDGRKTSDQSLRGRPYIADFIYTQCRNVCPAMTAKLVLLQRKLSQRELGFVSFSVDPDHDTPQALAEFARSFHVDDGRWFLLATERDSLQRIAAGFRVAADPTNDPSDPIIHSDLFFLVDADGQVRGAYPSRDHEALERLERDATKLTTASKAKLPSPSPGSTWYDQLGCAGCHSQRSLAPPLVNLLGAERRLEGGTRLTIDAAYLRSSILEPGRQVVDGYPPIMPSYANELSASELDALVAELLNRRMGSDVVEASAPVRLVEDPVCHMQVRAEASTPHVRHQEQDVYFCSQMCKEAFEKTPGRYPPQAK